MARIRIKRKNKTKAQYANPKRLSNKVAIIEQEMMRKDLPNYGIGDTVKAHVRIKEGEKERLQIFEGTVIARSNRAAGKSLVIRKISHGVGVERVFLESSPKLAKLDIVTPGRVRRSKLYYIRQLHGKAAKIEQETESSGAPSAAPAAPSTPTAS